MFLVKTQRNLEDVAAAMIEEETGAEAKPRPFGYLGLVIVTGHVTKDELEKIPEVERAIPVEAECRADPKEIAETAAELAETKISEDETFAVRTIRRGEHDFTSVDVNVEAGDAVRKATGASVDLDDPDKIVWVEILRDRAYLAVLPGEEEWKKLPPGKPEADPLLAKLELAQIPYLGDPRAAYSMGERIGRAVQGFELKSYIVTPYEPVNAVELLHFLRGLRDGVKSRMDVQRESYGREFRRTELLLYDLYQLIRLKRDALIIGTDPKGDPYTEIRKTLGEALREADEVVVLAGSRVGLPRGVLRACDFVVDLCPGVTFATEHVVPSVVTALVDSYLEAEGSEDREGR
ncbi:SPOUT family RNA methylase [Methanopyrus kandleri]|uniref:Predicted RNA-binding protein, contains THUMP domain n=2 Tax=Methanopyrus kandleri TaxID=2320 RepID=Q8TVD0_METKA|nr:SPOUT family RNA methylase [Methanopyrus kandleri]AAM02675.1 Predicted RNA-binding protein, contains THUMP domain [Methanopyrus kandleri AV19]HII70931.1 SPOUT family RNA methylase [Methanopyrus kandleri]